MLMSAYTASYGVRCAVHAADQRYGPGMQAKDSIVARLMRAIRLGPTFEIYGDGRQVRDYVHARMSPPRSGSALDDEDWSAPPVIGAGRSLSVLDVIDAVREVSGAEIDVTHGPARPGEMPAVIVDPAPRALRRLVAPLRLRAGTRGRLGGMVASSTRRVPSGLGALPVPGGAAK